jgi:Bacterial regulatory protein, arsR family
LEQLAQGERSVEVLAERTGLSVANASQHLQRMRRAGIVTTRREGKFIFCTLADEAVLDLMSALRRIPSRTLPRWNAYRSYFNDRDSLQPVSREIVIRSCAVAMTPASACSVHKRRPWLTQEARVSRPDGVRGWGLGAGGTPPGASPFNAGPAHAVPCLAKPNALGQPQCIVRPIRSGCVPVPAEG